MEFNNYVIAVIVCLITVLGFVYKWIQDVKDNMRDVKESAHARIGRLESEVRNNRENINRKVDNNGLTRIETSMLSQHKNLESRFDNMNTHFTTKIDSISTRIDSLIMAVNGKNSFKND